MVRSKPKPAESRARRAVSEATEQQGKAGFTLSLNRDG